MRRLLAILALLGLSVTYGAGTTRADGVDYKVSGTYAAITGSPSTPLSTPGDTFTFTFSVDPATLLMVGQVNGESNPIDIMFNYSDSSGDKLTKQPGVIRFMDTTGSNSGLFMIQFSSGTGTFFLSLEGPSGFNASTLTLNTGMFNATPGDTTTGLGSILGDFDPSIPSCNLSLLTPVCPQDAILSGTVDAVATTPEPSSLLLLGSGFIALGSFARKRFSTSLN